MRSSILQFATICAIATGSLGSATAQSDKMKAAIIHEYGPPSVLKFEEIAVPQPKENELLVRVLASSVNPADPFAVGGTHAKEWGTHLPMIPGYDMAGIVEKTGEKVTRFKKGDAVYGYALFGGAWAEYATMAETEAAPKPNSLTFTDAAAVPLAALTAWEALVNTGKLSPGQTVLIHGGSGGVGSFAIQIAKARGLRVIATASTKNQDLLKQLGADVAIDYTTTKFEDVAKDVDAVIDPIGKDTLARSYSVVKKGGIVMTLVSRTDKAELDKYGIRGASIAVRPRGDDLAEITQLIEEKKVRPIVTEIIPLPDAATALGQAATKHTRGKIVVKISDEPAK